MPGGRFGGGKAVTGIAVADDSLEFFRDLSNCESIEWFEVSRLDPEPGPPVCS